MFLIFLFTAIEPEIKAGLLYSQYIAGHKEFDPIYTCETVIYLSRKDCSFGFSGEIYYKQIDPYSNKYFQASGCDATIACIGIGGLVRWRFIKIFTAKASLGYYLGGIDRPVIKESAIVKQQMLIKRSPGVSMAWDIYKKISHYKLGCEFRINYIPLGYNPEQQRSYTNYDLSRRSSLTGIVFSLVLCL
ncbi:MAG: hypothetical protein ABIL05_00260 [candidate division WOR-3 bacterium]